MDGREADDVEALGLRRFLFLFAVVVAAVGGSGSEVVWRQESDVVVVGVWDEQEVVTGDVVVVAASSVSIWINGDVCVPAFTWLGGGVVWDEEEWAGSGVVSVVASMVVLDGTGDVSGPVSSSLGMTKGIGVRSGDA